MKQYNYFLVTRNADTTEGRGPKLPTDVAFTSQEAAVAFVESDHYKKWGVQNLTGSKYDVEETTVFVFDSVAQYKKSHPSMEAARKRQEALSKLTIEDRRALGLGDI